MYCRCEARPVVRIAPALVSAAAVAACLLLYGCARRPAQPQIGRVAILRFENLGRDESADWMGRAFSEIISAELGGAPGIYAIPSQRMHASNALLGERPISAPGISAERTMAVITGATRIGYGDYAVRGDRIEARLTIEDPRTGRMDLVAAGSADSGDTLGAATALARQVSAQLAPFGTRNQVALEAWVRALESPDPAAAIPALEKAIAADPEFGAPYRTLSELRMQHQDRAGAIALLEQALARGNRMSALERARLQFEMAMMGDDMGARRSAMAALAAASPRDPVTWRTLGEMLRAHREYRQAVQALERSLAIEPEDFATWNLLGYASAYNGDFDAAVSALHRYQALRPLDANPLDSLGDVHVLAGRLREAEQFYLQAAQKGPESLNGIELFKAAMARLMTGDVAGADELAERYRAARVAAKDPLVDYHQAEWNWVSGHRKQGFEQLAALARADGSGPLREAAARAWAELAVWSLVLTGDRAAAAELARRSAALAGPPSAALAALAEFLALPPASAPEWTARAGRAFPDPRQRSLRDAALAYALLLGGQFEHAAELLQRTYDSSAQTLDESTPLLLAWARLETGRIAEGADLLRHYPIPSTSGVGPFVSFAFPRFFYLRGLVAEKQGRREEARASYALFLKVSGPDPLVWGEEQRAAAGR